jgi:hypothetical protein
MTDLATMLWKESREFLGNRRNVRVFAITVLIFGVLPALSTIRSSGPVGAGTVLLVFRLLYSVFALVIVASQVSPDLVLRERVGRTFDWLLATRLPDWAIFSGKVMMSAVVAYVSAIVSLLVQITVLNLRSGQAWSWWYLGLAPGRVLIFAVAAVMAVYMSVIGTFVALRIADQRTAYLVTMLGALIVAVPFLLRWVSPQFTAAWFWEAAGVMLVVDAILMLLGIRLFRRDILVLTLYG